MRFIHTADWQIGKRFLQVEDSHYQARLASTRIDTIRHIAKLAGDHGAEFVVVAGDLFDSATLPRTIVAETLAAIGEIPVPVYAIPGNHDSGGPMSLWHQPFFEEHRSRAGNFHVLLANTPVELPKAVLLPCPLLSRQETDDTMRWLRNSDVYAALTADKPRIVIAHGTVRDFGTQYADDEEENDFSNRLQVDQLPRDEIDYVALGDWHGTLEVTPWAWYSGTPEFDRFRKSPDHDLGNVLLVEIPDGVRRPNRSPNVQKIATSIIGWHSLDFTFAGAESLDDLTADIDKLIGKRAMQDLLQLNVSGTLNLEMHGNWQQWVEKIKTRIIRLRLREDLRIVPTDEELRSIQTLEESPLTAMVFQKLLEKADQGGEEGEVAQIAVRELFGFVRMK